MHRIICDINLKTVYTDGRAEMVALHCGKASTSAFDILAGRAEAVGTQPYAKYLHFHKKGDVIL